MKHPLVSVIISTYNGSKYIMEAINSVLNQTYTNIEFIIINDSSIDNVEKIILNAQKKDKKIIYLKNKKNLGLATSLNLGINKSKGKYIARIDDDDIWCDKNKLKKQVNFMENNIDYGVCGTFRYNISPNGNIIGKWKTRINNNDIKNHILQANQIAHSTVLIRKNILLQVGAYNENYRYSQDYDLWLKIGQISKLYNIPDITVKYRILPTSISNNNKLTQELFSLKLITKYRKYYPNYTKAIILRIGYLFLPKNISKYILKKLKGKSAI